MKTDCVFCRIILQIEDAKRIYEDEEILVIEDINPRVFFHYLVMPKRHVESLMEMEEVDTLGNMILVAKRVAIAKGFAENGFRLVLNCGRGGGQTIDHLHIHLLGGNTSCWLPS